MAVKKVTFFFLTFLGCSQLVVSQDISALLASADSLFQSQKYTESYEIYENIFKGEEKYSAQMLLKMAYIKEGLGDFPKALYYLENYYRQTNDAKALQKIKEIVDQEDVNGYSYGDFTYAINYLDKYNSSILMGLVLLNLFLIGHLIWVKAKRGMLAKVTAVLLILVLVLTAVLVNVKFDFNEGIIIEGEAYAMPDPSAASDAMLVINKGDKVRIKEVGDIWTKIQLGDKSLYVRSNKIGMLL